MPKKQPKRMRYADGQETTDPEEIARVIEEYPPPPCANCGGVTGIAGTPGLMGYIKASGVKIVCSEECENIVKAQLAAEEKKAK